ncbi:MAG: DEAD/DEAH box helicase, partial [Desulfohalobiaceae bacterium]|nr:DEAD/DEAH box helicase [Desulfohalobiaceae bacterium]
HHPIIFMNCGPVRHKIDDKKQAERRPFTHKVIVKKTGFNSQPTETAGYSAIHELYKSLITDQKRNQVIVRDVLAAVAQNRFPVVLTERKKHLDILKDLIGSEVQNVIVMQGGMGKKQRKAALHALEQVPDDEGKVVLATGRYLGEGFDDDRLDTLFLTLPISWKGTIAQYAGRLHRGHDMKKKVLIYDYADLKVPMLSRMYERRLTGYRSIGYEIVV